MLTSNEIMAFVATADAEAAILFYRDRLGLRLVGDTQFALEFEAGELPTMLRVQKVEKLAPQPFTSLGWNVPDIAATIDALVASGVAFERYGFMEQDDRGVWTAPGGAKIAWFKDPDGNTLSIAEM